MPKRNNPFQQLIYSIHEQIGTDYEIKPSEFLIDHETGQEVEVDIVIRAKVAEQPLTISIEVTAQERRAGSEWINQMKEKHRSLPTDKLILVSRAGFAKTVVKKATAKNLELLTLSDAVNEEWTTIVNRISSLDYSTIRFTPLRCDAIVTDGSTQSAISNLDPGTMLFSPEANISQTLEEEIRFQSLRPEIFHPIRLRSRFEQVQRLNFGLRPTRKIYLGFGSNSERMILGLHVWCNIDYSVDSIPITSGTFRTLQVAFGTKERDNDIISVNVIEKLGSEPFIEIAKFPKSKKRARGLL